MKFFIILLLFGTSTCTPTSTSCALQACNDLDPEKINVHLIPHSHDDVGWLKTVDDYFFGLRNDLQNVGVQYTLDSVVQALNQDAKRRYIQVETAYFWKWWQRQTQAKKDLFKSFVDSGRIEMVGGGWSMNDEACVNYQSTINQFTWGLRLLNDTLGDCGRPRIGWQIDPFGHSREQASIFKQMGYDAIFFWRLSEDERKKLKSTKDMEFMWKSNDNFDNSEIFTSVMDSYFSPSDFCWDYLQCSSDAINDDVESFDYNLPHKVAEFSEHIANYSSYFKTNNILYAMGGDFQYQAAEMNYLNIDKLIKGFEGHNKYNVFYSTPSCYFQAVNISNPTLTVKESGDFFPYNENAHAYWAGYYTSRSTLKRFERMANNILQSAQNLNAFAKLKKICEGPECEENIRSLREAVGTMQHHDAITGTEKERVAYDYSRILTAAIRDTEKSIGNIIGNLLKKDNITEDVTLPLSTCLLTNISVCDQTMQNRSLIVLYNPLSKIVTYEIRVPVEDGTYNLTGPYGACYFELVEHMPYPVKYPFNTSTVELVAYQEIQPMAMMVYYLEKISDVSTAIKPKLLNQNEKVILRNDDTKIIFDPKTNKLTILKNEGTYELIQRFYYYVSNNGTGAEPGSGDNITSGAYVFRPENGTEAVEIGGNGINVSKYNIMQIEGKDSIDIISQFGDYIVQTMRLVNKDGVEYLEFDWMVGPLKNESLDMANNKGKEIIVRYLRTNITTDHFYTDSNGRQMIQRERNYYPYNNDSIEPVASNYYPVTSRISIKNKDEDFLLSVLTDRSQGGTSLNDGEVEFMLHRRTLQDDHKGLDETLEEMEYGEYIVTRGRHYVIMDSPKSSRIERILALNKLSQPWMLVADATSNNMTLEKLQEKLNFKELLFFYKIKIKFNGCIANNSNGLPPNLNVLNFEPWKNNSYLMRLEHIFEKNEDEEYSKDVSLEMKYMFNHAMDSIQELSLGANYFINSTVTGDNYKVTLSPMEIKTFVITFEDKK